MKHPKDHPCMKRLDEALTHFFVLKTKDPAIHDEDYEEMKQKILEALFQNPIDIRAHERKILVDHGIDIIGDEHW